MRYLAEQVGITEMYAQADPEQKLAIVRRETARGNTLFLGDGINDAPALTAATVGIAFGQNSDITAEAAGAVIMDTSLRKVDEFLHISRRLRRSRCRAPWGYGVERGRHARGRRGLLPPVAGAVLQEVIDLSPCSTPCARPCPAGGSATTERRRSVGPPRSPTRRRCGSAIAFAHIGLFMPAMPSVPGPSAIFLLVRLQRLVPDWVRGTCTIETAVAKGRTSARMLRLAAARSSDLIVMGVHRRGAVGLLLFGSNTHAVPPAREV